MLLFVVLFECVTRDAVFIMRLMIASCFLVIILSLTAGLLDVLGPTHIVCQALRSTASLSILSGTAVYVLYYADEMFVRFFRSSPER